MEPVRAFQSKRNRRKNAKRMMIRKPTEVNENGAKGRSKIRRRNRGQIWRDIG